MRVIAILEVDEEKLAETGHNLEDEMGWLAQSGISMVSHKKIETASEYEYAAFAWNTKEQKYEQLGRAVITERLCRGRFAEYKEKGYFNQVYDADRVIFQRRRVAELCEDWETIKEETEDGK